MVRIAIHRAIPTVIAALLLVASPAWAIPRYASPMGAGDCSQTSPCDLKTAVEGAADGDEVIVAPGDYGSPGEPLPAEIGATSAVDIHGPAGGPRPRIYSLSDSAIFVGSGAALRDIEIQHLGSFNALDIAGLAERVFVQSTANACRLAADGATVRNSVCWATQGASAVRMAHVGAMQIPPWTGTLRNVTAWSRQGEGIRVSAENFAQLAVDATNVIAHGGFRDVRAEVLGSAGNPSAEIRLDHSNYATRLQLGGGAATAPASDANQTAPPLFVDDPSGDFHQLAASPTIDAGIADAANGTADFDGQARANGANTDIGADEFSPPPPAPPAPVLPRSTIDRTRPVISGLTVRPKAFAARRGTRIRYRLSEAATVTFRLDRAFRGRRKGRRCVPRRRTGRRCARYIRLRGSFRHSGRRGANSLRYRGRLNGKRLVQGRYRLVAVAQDPAGNRSRTRRAGMRVVRR